MTLFCHEQVVFSKALGEAASVNVLVEVPTQDDLFVVVAPGEQLVCQLLEEDSARRTKIAAGLKVSLVLFEDCLAFAGLGGFGGLVRDDDSSALLA